MSNGLAELWQPFLRRGDGGRSAERRRHRRSSDSATGPRERLVVAEYDGEVRRRRLPQGQRRTRPVNLEPILQVHRAAVVPEYRRHGIGKALMECAVTWAEELGIGHVATAAAVRLPRGQPLHGAPRARAAGGAAGGADAASCAPSCAQSLAATGPPAAR